jgi:hypothetical protein
MPSFFVRTSPGTTSPTWHRNVVAEEATAATGSANVPENELVFLLTFTALTFLVELLLN